MFATAITLSVVAAYYSIAGLVAIFAAAVLPIVIMGSTLEVAKLVVASWLYRNWKEVPFMLKSYFTVALFILMCLTSMGIFGYLSKAHLDQAVPTGDVAAKVALLDEKIKTEKETIEDAKRTIKQLDQQVDQTISRTVGDTTTKGIDRSVSIRKSQSKERKQLFETISASQFNIAKLNEEKAPIQSQLRKVEAEVGPIKYIAAFIYGDNPDQNLLEKAVRWVIVMIVSVFDPLAVLMLIAANWSLRNRKKDETKEGWHQEWVPDSEAFPEWKPNNTQSNVPDIPPLTDEELNKLEQEANVDDEIEMKNLFEDDKEEFIPESIKPTVEADYEEYLESQKTIEQEVQDIQSIGTKVKEVEYDSVGRRITP